MFPLSLRPIDDINFCSWLGSARNRGYKVCFERRSDVVAYTELTDFSLCMGVADLNAKGDNEIFLMPTSWGS